MTGFITDIRNSFWFTPAVVVLLAIVCAVAALELDVIVGEDALASFPRLFGAGAEGARQILSAIATSTITVAGVVFSITIVALSLTAAQYSPRVLRNFMADRSNQVVLGVFVGIYVYCLIVLRTVRGGDSTFVPGISIVIALVLSIVGIGFLIYFIHHIAVSIQVSHIAAAVAHEAIAAVHATSRARGAPERRSGAVDPDTLRWHCLESRSIGYIQHVDEARLVRCAGKAQRVVRVERAVGDFILPGQPLVSISGDDAPPPELVQRVLASFAVNSYRDIRQDPAFGLQQLVDIVLKALSPGVNDLGTARDVLNYLTAVLRELAQTPVEDERYVYAGDALVLIRCRRGFEELLAAALNPIRHSARPLPAMILHLLENLAQIERALDSADRRAAVLEQADAIEQGLSDQPFDPRDLSEIDRALARLRGGRTRS